MIVVGIRLNVVMRDVGLDRAADVALVMGRTLENSLDLLRSEDLPDEVNELRFVGHEPPYRLTP